MKRFEIASAFFLTIVVVLLTCTACHARTIGSPRNNPLTLSQFLTGIITRTEKLNYISEQDSEVFAFYRNSRVSEMSDRVFLDILRRPVGTQIIKQSWSSFFQAQRRDDPRSQWSDIEKYLEINLTDLVVYRLPRAAPYEAQYDLYAVGLFNGEIVVGIQMFGVAT